jgi:hypothetical protein
MLVPDQVRKCVVFVGYKNAKNEYELAGTGFFVSRPSRDPVGGYGFSYLVTARHVIDGIRSTGADSVALRVNNKSGRAQWVEIPLGNWLFHPTDATVDVALMRCSIPDEGDHVASPLAMFVSEQTIEGVQIGVGDEVFLSGLFAFHHGEQRNIPIIRIGNIAAMPEEPVRTGLGPIDAYLVEARSIGGLSGSPVYVHVPMARTWNARPEFAGKDGSVFYLLGLMHGHWDVPISDSRDELSEDGFQTQRVNVGIAIVVPASKILEVISQPMIREDEDRRDEEDRKQNPAPTDGS